MTEAEQAAADKEKAEAESKASKPFAVSKEEWDKMQTKTKEQDDKISSMESDQVLKDLGFGQEQAVETPVQTQVDPNQIPQEFNGSWDAWHKKEPGAATDWRTVQVTKRERLVDKMHEDRRDFELGLTSTEKYAHLKDIKKRALDPTWKEFSRILLSNPALAANKESMEMSWERAEKIIGSSSGMSSEQAKEQGRLEEQVRQHQVETGVQAQGSGTGRASAAQNKTELNSEEKRYAGAFEINDEDYKKYKGRGWKANISYERAKRH